MVYVGTSVLVALCDKGAVQSDVRKTCAGGSVYGYLQLFLRLCCM